MAKEIKVKIGRYYGAEVDLNIDNDSVSRVHAEAWYEPALEMVVVKDLGSVNGTKPSGESKIAGDTIRVGYGGGVSLGEVELHYDQLKSCIDAKVAKINEAQLKQQQIEVKKRQRSRLLIGTLTGLVIVITGFFYFKLSANKQSVEASVEELARALKEVDVLMRNPPVVELEVMHSHEMINSFIAYTDGTAIDTRTGLMWSRCLLGQTWQEANKSCEGSAATYRGDRSIAAAEIANQATQIGKSNWRVPNRTELLTLVQGIEPNDYEAVFSNDPMGFVWSSTVKRNAHSHWNVNFADNNMYWNTNGYLHYVRLVRNVD
ncbi:MULTISPECIES: Lcl domain-containing protein [Nitrincola]|uniref:FHA domain-containing protein n=1 Tax=Nitrincola nitratireducens TaxID=1229521 RepID=W9UYU9_9GAMM|nr:MULTISPECIES: DUF1566 domain-containing protein [Nitrincola]EXJ09087.1 hypothetical protein D791_03993 [Nitrincola nitratireducens]